MPIEIRTAVSTRDREDIYRLRYQIYIEEIGYRHPQADHQRRFLPDHPERGSRLFMAVDGDRPVGTCKLDCGGEVPLTDEERQVYELDHFLPVVGPGGISIFSRYMVAPAHRSGDVPARLFDAAMQYIVDHDVPLMFLDCRPHLISTYERLGFQTYAGTYSDPMAGLLVPLVLLLDDRDHLRRIGSRFQKVIQSRPPNPARLDRIRDVLPHFSPVHTLPTGGDDARDEFRAVIAADDHLPVSIFDHLSEEDVAKLIAASHIIHCKPGDRIIAQDVSDQTVFMVLDGVVEVRREGRVLAVLSKGNVFGEVAFLLQGRRTADVIAVSGEVRVLALRQKALSQLIDSESGVAARFLLNLSRILAMKLLPSRG